MRFQGSQGCYCWDEGNHAWLGSWLVEWRGSRATEKGPAVLVILLQGPIPLDQMRFSLRYLWDTVFMGPGFGSCWGLKAFGVHCRLYQAPRSTTKLSEQLQETGGPRAGQGCISKEMSTEAPVLALAPGCLWESLPLWEHQFHAAYNWILWGPDSFTYRNLCCVRINKRSQSSKTLNYLNLFSATHRLQCSVLKQNWEYFSTFLSYTLSY